MTDDFYGEEIPIEIVELTEQDIADREQMAIYLNELEAAAAAKVAARESAVIKLAALGLTEEEAKAIVGV